jgi:hypothetical protein
MDKETAEELQKEAEEHLDKNGGNIDFGASLEEIIGQEYEEGECPTCSKPGRSGVRSFDMEG